MNTLKKVVKFVSDGKPRVKKEEGRLIIEIEDQRIMKKEEFEEVLYEMLKQSGFRVENTWEEKIFDNPWGYTRWRGVEEYRDKNDTINLYIYYVRVYAKGETTYNVYKIEVVR